MNFQLSPRLTTLRERIQYFVAEHILPLEKGPDTYDEHENIRTVKLDELWDLAQAEGLWAPQMPVELGGMGLSVAELAVCYEEMNRSIFGPVTFNCAALDALQDIVRSAASLRPANDFRFRIERLP